MTDKKPKSPGRRFAGPAAWLAAGGVILLVALAAQFLHHKCMDARLLKADADLTVQDAKLTRYAVDMAKPAYAKNCASCHGADMKGGADRGVPDLTDAVWLFDNGTAADIERTILYGIRAPNRKSRNITDMPAMGRQGIMGPQDVADVMTYLESAGGKPVADKEAVARGRKVYSDKGVCYDCHFDDAKGNSGYGAPNLIDDEWVYGGSRQAILSSIMNGRHGICPAFFDKLSPAKIRALAVYIFAISHKAGGVAPPHA